jgi:hypothetical protein
MRRSELLDEDRLHEALDEFEVLHVNRARRRRPLRAKDAIEVPSRDRWIESRKTTPRRLEAKS